VGGGCGGDGKGWMGWRLRRGAMGVENRAVGGS